MAEPRTVKRTNQVPLLPLRIGGTWIAVPALQVLEVVDERAPIPLPRAPAHLPGLLNLRGTALPLLDLTVFLEIASKDALAGGFPRVVVVGASEMQVGIRCDQVLGVIAAGDATMGDVEMARGKLRQFSIAEVETLHGIAAVVDLEALLGAGRVRQ